jgi:tetratricopeptide (TPR) repeat protein
LHQALYPLGELQRACTNMAEAERVAERLGDRIRLSRVLSSQIYLLGATGDLAGAIAVGERALNCLAEQDDLEAALNTRLMLARSLYAAGRYGEAIHRAQDAVALLRDDVERGAVPGMNQTVSARVWLTLCHAELGRFEEGAAEGAMAMRLATHPRCSEHDVVWSRVGVGRLLVVRGEFMAAIATLTPALPLCKDELAIYFSRVASSLGSAYAAAGRVDEGLALLEQADNQARMIGFTFGQALVLAQLGAAYLLAGEADRAQKAGDRAVEAAQRWGERGNEAWALCLLGDVAAARGQWREAQVHYQKGLAVAGPLQMLPARGRCREGLDRLLHRR